MIAHSQGTIIYASKLRDDLETEEGRLKISKMKENYFLGIAVVPWILDDTIAKMNALGTKAEKRRNNYDFVSIITLNLKPNTTGKGHGVIGYDPYLGVHSALRLNASVKIETKPEAALAKADYVSLHLPSLPSTNGMFNAELLSNIKPGAIFLNFSRDKLVEEDAMIKALESGKISKYITDFAFIVNLTNTGELS